MTRAMIKLTVLGLIATFLLAPRVCFASSCKVITNDIGTIHGSGKTPSAAFQDAAEQCFDRRSKLFQIQKGGPVDMDTGVVMIDACANITCT